MDTCFQEQPKANLLSTARCVQDVVMGAMGLFSNPKWE
jgi:hypothetical protein